MPHGIDGQGYDGYGGKKMGKGKLKAKAYKKKSKMDYIPGSHGKSMSYGPKQEKNDMKYYK